MRTLPLRLPPGAELREALHAVLREHSVDAAFVIAGIGSLNVAQLRLAGADTAQTLRGDLEILTLSGSIAVDGVHLHASIADADGRVWGGHVAPGCIVRTTAELLLALLPDWHFGRAADPATGFAELNVRPR
jgi:predicted DNA-binding protein with PD1-like motif